jgi:hypothetical protein
MDIIKRTCEENEIQCNHYPFMLENIERTYNKKLIFFNKNPEILWFHIYNFEKLIHDLNYVLKQFKGFLRIIHPDFEQKLIKYYEMDVKIVIIMYKNAIHVFPLSELDDLKMFQIIEKQYF